MFYNIEKINFYKENNTPILIIHNKYLAEEGIEPSSLGHEPNDLTINLLRKKMRIGFEPTILFEYSCSKRAL